MNPQGWREIRALFDELSPLLPFARQERLDAIGAVHPELCRSVQALLDADAAAAGRLRHLDSFFGVSVNSDQRRDGPEDEVAGGDPLGLTGRLVSHFEVREAFGAGGMGVVYRAQDCQLGRLVALKFLLPRLSLDAAAKARFLREARTAGALDHANLCTIHEVGESAEGLLFLTMPLYPGETLRARLRREGRMAVADGFAVARLIAQGLSAVHGAGVVHRDLKPGNVMLLPDGGVKLLDFGLATIRELRVVGSDLRLGTLPYMAPEQVRQAGEVDGRGDLWALGVVLYEMLTGQLPFGRDRELTTVVRILGEEPVPPSTLRQDVPAAADRIVMTLLQKEPGNRYASADALLQDLLALAEVETVSSVRGWRVRPQRLLLLIFLMTLVLAVPAGMGMLRSGAVAVLSNGGRGTTPLSVGHGTTEASSIADPFVRSRGETGPTADDYVARAREFLLRFNQRDNDAGLDLLRQALELDPNYPDAHAVLAMALAMRYWQIGDRSLLGSAIAAGRRAISLDSSLAGAYSSLGWALDHWGDREAALRAHRQAVKLSPNLSDGLAVLHHWSFGRLDEAARWWAPALARNPTNTNTYWHAGKTYLCLGMLPRARELFAKSVAFEPSFAWAHYSLTLVFLREGNRGQARAQIEKMIAANQEDSTALTLAGLGALAMAEPAAARAYFERGLLAAPAYVKRHGTVGLAWILQHSGEEARARDLVRDALRQFQQFWGGHPKRPEDFMDLARIRLLQGNREEAIELMEMAVSRGWRFVDHQPNALILQSLRGNPRYDDLMADVHADIERMRARVETEGW